MKLFWIIATVFFTVTIVFSYYRNRKLVTIPNIIFLSTTVNFILYLQGWSNDFTIECQDITYCVIGVVQVIFGIYAIMNNKVALEGKNRQYYLKRFTIGSVKICMSTLMIWLCILLTAVEAVYLNGSLITFESKEFHTLSMPVIGTIVRGLYPVSYIAAYLDWKKFKKKSTPVLVVLCILYALFATGSRFWTIISILTVCFFILEYEKDLIDKLPMKTKVIICILAYILFSTFIQLGIDRVGQNHIYMDLISYTGPFKGTWAATIFSWFYGYFPYSFYNLNVTLKHIVDANICTYGQFLVYPYVSFLHLDGLLGIDYQAITSNTRIISNTAATVATGYFEFFADFRNFFAVGLLILVAITIRYERRRNLSGFIGFASMETVWFLMSFNNNYTVGITIYVFFFAWVLNRFFAVEFDESLQENDSGFNHRQMKSGRQLKFKRLGR